MKRIYFFLFKIWKYNLQNYWPQIHTIENRNLISFHLRIFAKIFQLNIGRKIRVFSFGWK